MMNTSGLPMRAEDVEAALQRVRDHVVRTPLLYAHDLSARVGGRVFVKCENLQRFGAFKIRGASNRLAQLSETERGAGVVAWSSGNHAQGVAGAARLYGTAATIVMPKDAPAIKVENTKALGANIIFYDRYTESREAIARTFAAERGATIVPPYDDVNIIAGQGTIALEVAAQLGDEPHALLAPCGGGGLIAGCGLALSKASPRTRIFAVEPAGYDDHSRSLRARERVTNSPTTPPSICDALLVPTPGEITWEINKRLLADGFVVSDDEVLAAIRYAWRELKLVVEPGGSVALAAILHGRLDCRDQTVVIVLSGGNVDAELFGKAIR